MFFRARPFVDFKPPKLHRSEAGWYVWYCVRNPQTGKFVRYRIKLNRGPVKDRLAAAREIMAALNEKLSLGWSPLGEKTAPRSTTGIGEILDTFDKVKAKEMRAQSLATYRSYVRVFRRWLNAEGCEESMPVSIFDKEAAISYMDYLEEREDISPRAYNNYLSFMCTLFDWMKEKGYVSSNPFEGIKRKPKKMMTKKRRMLTDDELEGLLSFLYEENIPYLAACLLCLCCFMRPKEIALLQCSDIDLQRQVVHVDGSVAKNGNESFRTIPDSMMPVLRMLDLSKPSWYIFGKHNQQAGNFSPAPFPLEKKKFSDYWNRVVREHCGFGEDLQFYSLKDTGITRMLGKKVPISFVQQQADHSSVAMTAVYVGKSALANDALKGVDILPRHPLQKKSNILGTLELEDDK